MCMRMYSILKYCSLEFASKQLHNIPSASIITAVPMHLSRFFQLKPIVRWVFRGTKKPDSIHSLLIPTIKYYHT